MLKVLFKTKYSFIQALLIVATIFYLFTLFVFIEREDTYLISKAAFVVAFVLSLLNTRVLVVQKSSVLLFFFVLVCAITCFWSPIMSTSLSMVFTLIQLLAMFIVLSWGFRDFGNEDLFLTIILAAGYLMCIYYLFYYGLSGYVSVLTSAGRLGSDFENTNTIGGSAAFVFVLSLYVAKKWSKIWLLFAILPAIILLGAGSRTAIFVALIGLLSVLLCYLFNKNNKKPIRTFVIVSVFLLGLYFFVVNIPNIEFMSSIYNRFQTMFDVISGNSTLEGSVSYRIKMVSVGFDTFLAHPLFGYGINSGAVPLAKSGINYTAYHNNYIEILADAGIVGFALYYGLYLRLLVKSYKSIKNNQSFAFIMLCMMLVLDVGGVTYYQQRNYLLLIFISLVVENKKIVSMSLFKKQERMVCSYENENC